MLLVKSSVSLLYTPVFLRKQQEICSYSSVSKLCWHGEVPTPGRNWTNRKNLTKRRNKDPATMMNIRPSDEIERMTKHFNCDPNMMRQSPSSLPHPLFIIVCIVRAWLVWRWIRKRFPTSHSLRLLLSSVRRLVSWVCAVDMKRYLLSAHQGFLIGYQQDTPYLMNASKW